jgi:hypothetical protein
MPDASMNEAVSADAPQSELEGGVFMEDLPQGVVLEVETNHHRYTIVNRTHGEALISGHPTFCPEPIAVRIEGSTWGGYVLKAGFIGLGMRLTFQLSAHRTITTSPIMRIRASQPLAR